MAFTDSLSVEPGFPRYEIAARLPDRLSSVGSEISLIADSLWPLIYHYLAAAFVQVLATSGPNKGGKSKTLAPAIKS